MWYKMTPLALQAHLQMVCRIVSDTTVVLRKFWAALGQLKTITRDEQWFQQNGATPHTSSNTLLWLRQPFKDWPISRRCDTEWAPHSPNLNTPDFYHWGYLKNWVYKNNPQTVSDLKTAIAARIRAIPIQECACVMDSFACCLQVCLQHQGNHLEHILERT